MTAFRIKAKTAEKKLSAYYFSDMLCQSDRVFWPKVAVPMSKISYPHQGSCD